MSNMDIGHIVGLIVLCVPFDVDQIGWYLHKEMMTEQLLTTNSPIFEDSSLSSDNSTDSTVIGQYQDVDVLSLALAASDIIPEMTNLNQHNIYMVPKHIAAVWTYRIFHGRCWTGLVTLHSVEDIWRFLSG
jgi:hypothetical protein